MMGRFGNKHAIVLLLIASSFLVFIGCPQATSSKDDPVDPVDTRLALSGTMNLGSGTDAKPGLFKAVLSSTGVSRATTNEYYAIDEKDSYIICDDITFKLSGEYNKTTKQFNASSKGTFAGIDMVFSITCTYDSTTGAVTEGSAGLAVTVGGVTTVFTGPLDAKGTQASKTGEVRHYAGYYYSLDTTLTPENYKTKTFSDTDFAAAKASSEQMVWGQMTLTIDADNRVTGTCWTDINGVSARWYITDDGTAFDGTKFKFKFIEPAYGLQGPIDYTADTIDTTMQIRDDIFNGVFALNTAMNMYGVYKLERVTASKEPSALTVTELPFVGTWDIKPDTNDYTQKLNMTNESFACTFNFTNGDQSKVLHGVVVDATVDGITSTVIIKYTKDPFIDPENDAPGMEGMYAKMIVTKVNDNKYTWIESVSSTGPIDKDSYWDVYDYNAVKALNFDSLSGGYDKDNFMQGTFEK